jgi:hypothetical protein
MADGGHSTAFEDISILLRAYHEEDYSSQQRVVA